MTTSILKNKILIVEDNAAIREDMIEILKMSHYIVYAASDGVEGFLKAKLKMPDLIIGDIRMPHMDGYEMLRKIRQEPTLKNVIFIFLTAACEKADIEKAFLLGADDLLVKPVSFEIILQKLQDHLLKLKKKQ